MNYEASYKWLEAEILRISRSWSEHPEVAGEDYDGPCECLTCRQYGAADNAVMTDEGLAAEYRENTV